MSVTDRFFPISIEPPGSPFRIARYEVEDVTFQKLGLVEHDIEEFVRRNIGVLFPDSDESLLVIGQQARNQQGGIADLVAVDADGNVVLVELKRDRNDMEARREPFEFQAVRYAANYAKLTSAADLVERLFAPYVERHRSEYQLGDLTPSEYAGRLLSQFLAENKTDDRLNNRQRIVLVASAFDPQTLSACAWLAKNGVDIRCVALSPARYEGRHFLAVEQVIPPPVLDDYFVEVAAPKSGAGTQHTTGLGGRKGRTPLPRMSKLFEWGILKRGDVVYVQNHPAMKAQVLDDKHVEYNGKQIPFNAWATSVTGWSAINVYEWVVKENGGQTLDDLRRARMNQETATSAAGDESAFATPPNSEPPESIPDSPSDAEFG